MDNTGNKIYVGDVGLAIIVDLSEDIEGATDCHLLIRKPGGTEVEWPAEVYAVNGNTQYLRYYTVAGDLNLAGRYKVQPEITLSGWTGKGETDEFRVYRAYR